MKKLILLICLMASCACFAQLNLQLESNLSYPGHELANIGGYVDSLGNEYALVGGDFGLDIVDVTVPTNPVKKFNIPCFAQNNGCIWREVKTYRHYAYSVTEAGDGVTIMDLSHLPDTIFTKQYTGDGTIAGLLSSVHALHIDTAKAFLYLYGSQINAGNTLFISLNDPWNPVYAGEYLFPSGGQDQYVHDGYALNDTLYEAHINAGLFTVVDVRDKQNPVLLATQTTPTNFTHNTWLSDDHHTLFTTDENTGSFLGAYDITNLSNIQELSRFQATPGGGTIIHNVQMLNDYAVVSWYVDGVIIVDEARPRNPIEVARYDTYSGSSADGYNGDWGVYPYLPSGNIVVSDIDNGLFVFAPTYKRGCYLEGTVTDSVTTSPIFGATIQVVAANLNKTTDVLGEYRTGTVDSGTYVVKVSKLAYRTKYLTVHLNNGVLTQLDVQLVPTTPMTVNGTVTDSLTGQPVANANVSLSVDGSTITTTANAGGNFSFSSVYPNDYTMYVGHWGYRSACLNVSLSPGVPVNAQLSQGYYDDFNLDLGWNVNGSSPNVWVRAIPVGTYDVAGFESNPAEDAFSDCGGSCFVTDNGGAPYYSHDVDNGNTILTSPVFDATLFLNPVLSYSRWYFTESGTPNDTMFVRLSNGSATVDLETITPFDTSNGIWTPKSFTISSVISPTANMQLIVEVSDNMPGNIVEGAFDQFEVSGILINKIDKPSKVNNVIAVYPNPFNDEVKINYLLSETSGSHKLFIRDVAGRELYSQQLSTSTGNVILGKDLPAGIYFVSLESENASPVVSKIIKE